MFAEPVDPRRVCRDYMQFAPSRLAEFLDDFVIEVFSAIGHECFRVYEPAENLHMLREDVKVDAYRAVPIRPFRQ